jgi:hypothetical protein
VVVVAGTQRWGLECTTKEKYCFGRSTKVAIALAKISAVLVARFRSEQTTFENFIPACKWQIHAIASTGDGAVGGGRCRGGEHLRDRT